MTFLHPILLAAGLASVAIPIAIHLLLRQRRRPIMWAAMRFLFEAYRKQQRRLRLEHWLLLAARCLLLALVGLALARPLFDQAGVLGAAGGRTVYIVIDNSIAAGLANASGETGLARHQRAAEELLASLGPSDRAGLITLAGPAEPIVAPASADVSAVRRLVGELQPTDSAADLSGAFERTAAAIRAAEADRARPTTLVILSDFFVGSADVSRPIPPSLADLPNVTIAASNPADSSAGNVQVVGIEPLRAVVLTGGAAQGGVSQREQVRVTLRRSGASVSEGALTSVRLRALRIAGAEGGTAGAATQASLRWQPGQTEATISMQVDPLAGGSAEGASGILIAEIDRDPLSADNTFRKPVGVRESLRAGVIARPRFVGSGADRMSAAQWLRLALRPTPGTPVDVVDVEPSALDAGTLSSLDIAFLPEPELVRDEDWAKLARFAESGGLLVAMPSAEASVQLWSDAFVRELGLDWRIAREPKAYEQPIGLSDEATADASGGLLSLLAAELPSLSKPVRVFRTLPIEDSGAGTRVLLTLADGSPWALAASPRAKAPAEGATPSGDTPRDEESRGLVVYLASAPALSWTDLPAKPLMVPLVQELARQGFGLATGSWASVAGRAAAAPARSVSLRPFVEPGAPDAGEAIAVSDRGVSVLPMRRAGIWTGIDDAGRQRGVVAVNPDADGARVMVQDAGAVRAWLASALGPAAAGTASERVKWLDASAAGSVSLAAQPVDSPISVPLLIAVLLLAMVELVMARFFSHAVIRPGPAAPLAPAPG